ncbi:RUS1 family protein-like protein [Lasiodiplodia hormozganensis]|uniref:RUS1 family protein-like protein n=1 Tax=Lasiodiplodia hormozganensis TaxID=869390 RepID=A0AA40CWF3_9PEZI|nr:RUS1 family protein-like protein [Lasiodiplodia hormozganensis]
MATHPPQLELAEYDDAGNITATYIETGPRIDVILPEKRKTLLHQALDVFLPTGYPQSVTEDYMPFAGVGVGDASASPTAALLLSVLQESTGRVATILFAAKLGTSLEPECKAWRLAADFFNDAAMLLDCVSPALPRLPRVLVLSFSSILRALCGVAAGSSKASLSAHFARMQNLGELNAAGSVVVSWVSSPLATWVAMLLLLTTHLGTNYAAVRAVSMRSLNRQRANIVMTHLLAYDKILSPQQVSQRERIFELRDGALRWADDQVIGRCRIGVRLAELVARLPGAEAGAPAAARKTGAVVRDAGASAKTMSLSTLLKVFEHESYLLWFDSARSEALIVLKQSCEPAAQLQAWTQALLLASRHGAAAGGRRGAAATQTLGPQSATSQQGLRQAAEEHGRVNEVETELRLTLEQTRQMFGGGSGSAKKRLEAAGWDLSIAALETHPGTRAGVRASLWPEEK